MQSSAVLMFPKLSVRGQFSFTRLTKARAKIVPGHKIVLRYYGKHGWAEMTYERRLAEMGKTSLS